MAGATDPRAGLTASAGRPIERLPSLVHLVGVCLYSLRFGGLVFISSGKGPEGGREGAKGQASPLPAG